MTRIRQIDAFTDSPFSGNPAGVCILDAPADPGWMQNVAAEMNVSETAFLWPEQGGFRLRWFTPSTEVDLCGHATLASAHALWESGTLPGDQKAIFYTKSGVLSAERDGEEIRLDFPSEPPEAQLKGSTFEAAIGTSAVNAARNRFDVLVQLDSADAVRNLQPDLAAIQRMECRGMIVTALSDDPAYDFVSRFFAPASGIDEDPVTGSAHCFLGPYWAERLGKEALTGYQASRRGGVVRVELHGDRVRLGGQAVTVLDAELLA